MAQAARLTRRLQIAAACACLLGPGIAAAESIAPEVYRDDAMSIRAGVNGAGPGPVRLGEALKLAVEVRYDANSVSVPVPGEALFTSAWNGVPGIALLDWHATGGASADGSFRKIRAEYRFQITACPNDEPLCPGDRRYRLPSFTLAYRSHGAASDAATDVRFTPWPGTLTVDTSIVMDDEGQLAPFETYFPGGAYPKPLAVRDGTAASLVTAGFALVILTGGLLMWPFGSRKQKGPDMRAPRWQVLLDELQGADAGNDARFLDALRRCLVWYCSDELDIDPFLWLDLAEPGEDDVVDRGHQELHALFVELLHSPAGKSPELLAELKRLTAPAQAQ